MQVIKDLDDEVVQVQQMQLSLRNLVATNGARGAIQAASTTLLQALRDGFQTTQALLGVANDNIDRTASTINVNSCT